MSVGYPDYSRLSRSGGYLLYSGSGLLPYGTALFQGYVGNFPYLTIGLNCDSSADYVKVIINYFSDSTFTNNIGFRYLIRTGAQYSITQYANISEWAQVFYITKSGAQFPFLSFVVYGAQGRADPAQLDSSDVPLANWSGAIPANGNEPILIQHVRQGSALISGHILAASWEIILRWYNYSANAFQTLAGLSNSSVQAYFSQQMPLLDVPLQLTIYNHDSTSQDFYVGFGGV